MLGVLLESSASRQRRDGGAALSVATHVAIIGLVAAATAKTPPHPWDREPVLVVRIAPPVTREARLPVTRTPVISQNRGWTVVPSIQMPAVVPPTLPPIEFGAPSDPTPTELAVGVGQRGVGQLGAVDLGEGGRNADGSMAWDGRETLMRLVVAAKPRYPDRLRNAGVGGRVRVRFVVDTTGRIELASVQILESTHELFTSAVREVLPAFRFRPSEANGQRVQSLAEMPFEFQIAR